MYPVSDTGILGDDFVASSYHQHLKKVNSYKLFLKENFQIRAFCGNKYASNDVNPLNRLINSLIAGINDEIYLLDYVLFVLDADLIDHLKFIGYGVSTTLGSWLEWLFKELNDCIRMRVQQLEFKALKEGSPQIYWIAAPLHQNWSDEEYQVRIKFSNCLESVADVYGNWMQIIKMKEF